MSKGSVAILAGVALIAIGHHFNEGMDLILGLILIIGGVIVD